MHPLEEKLKSINSFPSQTFLTTLLFFSQQIKLFNLPQVKRDGDKNVKCTMLFMLNYQPLQYRVEGRMAKLLALHTQTRPVIIQALWQYIKNKKLQV